jgi:dipeptidyl aminopeptidase/acylaminoacyl peptidase
MLANGHDWESTEPVRVGGEEGFQNLQDGQVSAVISAGINNVIGPQAQQFIQTADNPKLVVPDGQDPIDRLINARDYVDEWELLGGVNWELSLEQFGPAWENSVYSDRESYPTVAGTNTHFGDVAEFAWREDGSLLAMAVRPDDASGSGIQLYDPTTGTLRTLASGDALYRQLAWRTDADDLAALRAIPDTAGRWEDTTHAVLAWRGLSSGSPAEHELEPASTESIADTMGIPGFDAPRWADDGSRLFFGIRPRDADESAGDPATATDTAAVAPDAADAGEEAEESDAPEDRWLQTAEDTAGVLVWHWKDVDVMSRQERTAERDRRRTLTVAWEPGGEDVVHLGRDLREDVELLEGDRLAAVTDPVPYRQDRMFGPEYRDVYVADVTTGERTRAIEGVQYYLGPSPGGGYLLYLEDDHYHTYDVATGTTSRVTEGIPADFVDHDDDHTVDQKPPFGTAGWTTGDDRLLAYSEHDVWRIAPDGSGAANLTRSDETSPEGDTLRYRHVDLMREDPWEPDFIDPGEPLYLSVYDEWREMHGYARLDPGADVPERLVWKPKLVGGLRRAENGDVYLFREEDFSDSPDWFVAGPDLADARRVTETNPFMDEYAWGRTELLEYENQRGETLQGALFYPADYEPGEKYPMITYIYEIRSPSARYFSVPSRTNPYNPSVFTAEGYFVWQPDITYRDRNPGLSAVEAIVPSVERVLDTGMVDSARVGLVGHSWGGYQTAFTVTQTDLFRAAVAGAPLTNLVSMYHSIYWRTGGTDARIFEISQGRMEVPPYMDMDSYVANSPLHHVESMDTPLLLGFGSDDGAVEYNQGVEFYNAARRAGKPLVMLTYRDENHGISRRDANAMDYRDRVLAWFDHWLKDGPDPGWIQDGTTYLELQEEKETHLEEIEARDGGG